VRIGFVGADPARPYVAGVDPKSNPDTVLVHPETLCELGGGATQVKLYGPLYAKATTVTVVGSVAFVAPPEQSNGVIVTCVGVPTTPMVVTLTRDAGTVSANAICLVRNLTTQPINVAIGAPTPSGAITPSSSALVAADGVATSIILS